MKLSEVQGAAKKAKPCTWGRCLSVSRKSARERGAAIAPGWNGNPERQAGRQSTINELAGQGTRE